MNFKERSKERSKRIVANYAKSFEESEIWDLEFWQKQTPQMRLSALVSIIEDIKNINSDKLKE